MSQIWVKNDKKICESTVDKQNNKIKRVNSDLISKYKDIDELKEDANFLREIDEAYKLHDEGKVVKMNADTFLKELRKW